MSRLVPFPDDIRSLPDADLLDLNVLVSADVHGGRRDVAFVEARARYATSASASHIRDFYHSQFARAGAATIHRVPSFLAASAAGVVASSDGGLSVLLADDRRTRCDVAIADFGGYRAVTVVARYGGFDPRSVFERFARWHNGSAPVSIVSEPTALEISTFASGREPNTLVLYSTDYASPTTPRLERRAMVDSRITELGWSYREPREGIMFFQDGLFDAEAHVMGDETSSNVTFVGEFQLR